MYVKATYLNDKGTKITFTNGRKRNTKKEMRMPVDPFDEACPGGTLNRYVQSLAPHQIRFYTYPAKEHERRQLNKLGLGDVMYSPNKPIGKNKINTFMKEACEKLKLKSAPATAFAL